jgi:hypothetical protein
MEFELYHFLTYSFQSINFWSYIMPLMGAYVADQYWGRFSHYLRRDCRGSRWSLYFDHFRHSQRYF